MDKIQKALEKLRSKEKNWVKQILEQLKSGNLSGLDVKKLKKHADIYRVRKGDIRIIYRQVGEEYYILAIERRSEKTYRDF